jgi:hypothetical protein
MIGPVFAPAGTKVVIEVGLELVIEALTPPNSTCGTKTVPVIVTAVPTGPLVGEIAVIEDGG